MKPHLIDTVMEAPYEPVLDNGHLHRYALGHERRQKSCPLCTCLQNARLSLPGSPPSRTSAKAKGKYRQKRQIR